MLLDDNEAQLAQGARLADENISKLKPWLLAFGLVLLVFNLLFWFLWIGNAMELNMTFPPQNEEQEELIWGLFFLIILGLYNLRFLLHYRYINNYLQTKEPEAFSLFLKKQLGIWRNSGCLLLVAGVFATVIGLVIIEDSSNWDDIPEGPDTNIVVTSGDTSNWNRFE